MLRPWLLLLIHQGPGHGYELMARLKALGVQPAARAVYATLRWLDKERMVESTWQASRGPARRIYRVTAVGEASLEAWSRHWEGVLGLHQEFLARTRQVVSP